jgi:uracil-DNA glycosylase family 4
MFTGDRSGQWLFRALHRAGFASQSSFERADDGMQMVDCAITAVCHCAPPQNKPTRGEVRHCEPFLRDTINLLQPNVYVCLGQLAWNEVVLLAMCSGILAGKKPKFGHGAVVEMRDRRWLVGSYHPSQQNTFTGRLTEKMLDNVFELARCLLDQN